jgi:hypothetical protein
MLTSHPPSGPRRSVYALLLALAVLGPVVGPILSYSRVGPKWLEGVSYVAGFAGIASLCLWCATYVREEPRLVRIALFWIALLFLIIICGFLTVITLH